MDYKSGYLAVLFSGVKVTTKYSLLSKIDIKGKVVASL